MSVLCHDLCAFIRDDLVLFLNQNCRRYTICTHQSHCYSHHLLPFHPELSTFRALLYKGLIIIDFGVDNEYVDVSKTSYCRITSQKTPTQNRTSTVIVVDNVRIASIIQMHKSINHSRCLWLCFEPFDGHICMQQLTKCWINGISVTWRI